MLTYRHGRYAWRHCGPKHRFFTSKIAIVIRGRFWRTWQKLNVTAFLATGIVWGERGDPWASLTRMPRATPYHRLAGQPIIVFSGGMRPLSRRSTTAPWSVRAPMSLYIEEMFPARATMQPIAATVRASRPETMNVVGPRLA